MSTTAKLSFMMFLQFFIWGAWLPMSFGFYEALGFTEKIDLPLLGAVSWQIILLNYAFPLSAILGMFFSNQMADRSFAAEKFLAVSHLIGGLVMAGFGYLAWTAFSGDKPTVPSYWLFLLCMAVHCVVYVPTISVTNTLVFANMDSKDFGKVRLWGTIGWIAASWPFVFILVDWAKVPTVEKAGGTVAWIGSALGTPLGSEPADLKEKLETFKTQLGDKSTEEKDKAISAEKKRLLDSDADYKKGVKNLNQGKSWAFIVAGIASLLLAAFSFGLPHTPPRPAKQGEEQFALLQALKLLKVPFILVLFIVTFIDATVHDGYFFYAFSYLEKVGVPANWVQPAMSVGQIAEILTMAWLAVVLKQLGWRTTMIIGVLGHAVRFALFAFVPNPTVAVAANLLHGICYAFFFATLYIFIDDFFPKDARTSAQGLFNFLVLGLGPIVARFVWPTLQDRFTTNGTIDYSQLLLIPSGAAVVGGLLLLLFFHPPSQPSSEAKAAVAPH